MKKKDKNALYARILSLTLALAVAVTFTPLLGSDAYAASKNPGQNANEKLKYIDDGTEKTLDPEIFTEKDVLNPDDATLKDLGIGVEPEPEGLAPEPAPADTDSIISSEDIVSEHVGEKAYSNISSEFYDNSSYESSESDSVDSSDEAEIISDDMVSDSDDVTVQDAEMDQVESNESSNKNIIRIQEIYKRPTINVSVNPSTGIATITGTLANNSGNAPHYYFGVITVDGKSLNDAIIWQNTGTAWLGNNVKSLNHTFSMKNYSMGYHSVYVLVYYTDSSGNSHDHEWLQCKNVPTYMYSIPNSGGTFEVYSTYMNYMPTVFMSGGVAVRMQYSSDGVNWSETGYMPYYYQTYTIGGLAPNTTYQTRIYFYQTTPINGHYFNGAETGSFLYTGSYRTGIAKLPKIKSIKVKAYKVKKRKAGVYGWYTGYYFGSVKYYTYKIKVTVEFKKKPKLKGIYINGVWKKGRKKKYTLKLGTYANYTKPRGKKFNVYVYTAQNPGGYGGYSPMYSKKKKVK